MLNANVTVTIFAEKNHSGTDLWPLLEHQSLGFHHSLKVLIALCPLPTTTTQRESCAQVTYTGSMGDTDYCCPPGGEHLAGDRPHLPPTSCT